MAKVLKEYDIKLDSKKRVTIRNPQYDYYHIKELENGFIILEPRQLVEPFPSSGDLIKEIGEDTNNLEKGSVSAPIDLDGYLAIKEWIKTKDYISITRIQIEFGVGFPRAHHFINRLMEDGLIKKATPSSKGYEVIKQ